MTELLLQDAAHRPVPIIDIALLRQDDPQGSQTIAQQFRKACMTTGFFYIANHGVDASLRARLFVEVERFFAQPLVVKERVAIVKGEGQNGYSGIGSQRFDPAMAADNKESMYIGVEHAADRSSALAGTPLHGPNRWPDFLPGWHEAVRAYMAAMEELARLLLDGLALSLDLPRGFFDASMTDDMSALRLLHYPPHPAADPQREVGIGAHTDWGAVTILAQDGTGGLEIQLPSGAWVAAPPVPDTFIVNIGDMMARWTNDLYTSTPHRVLNRSDADRHSAAFFVDPRYDTQVECFATCCGADRPARYSPITAGEHILEMKRRTYGF
ncbi:MAG TPA: 2-oxoglutarate and iron-dependent oxygenase domain-containing protein [Stellaceae bacterium]|nr:2-oxoglutarate and iron-dependent oxygenase domain-containing protein [Stellaceae bacterium]